MQMYGYAPLTGIYTGPVSADPCPLGSGAWISPAFSTDAPPPVVGPKQAAVFRDGVWSVVADHRGETWWSGLQSVLIQSVGDPAASGLTPEPPPGMVIDGEEPARPLTLVEYAARARWLRETAGVIVVMNIPVRTDSESRNRIYGARLLADAETGFMTNFVAADGTTRVLNAEQVIALSKAVARHVDRGFEIFAQVKDRIEAGSITTAAQIDAEFSQAH